MSLHQCVQQQRYYGHMQQFERYECPMPVCFELLFTLDKGSCAALEGSTCYASQAQKIRPWVWSLFAPVAARNCLLEELVSEATAVAA